MTDLPRTLRDLYARVPLGMRLGLEPMLAACAKLGNPERAFPSVHVAGTNGKGSVSAMVEAIARADGKKTGHYCSPHLHRFAERIRINGEPISDTLLARMLQSALAANDLSFFEAATLAAFLAFREEKVDLGVLEVGLGGRLDATNVIQPPAVGAITRIALDHTDRLGNTLVEIAREKAGILKRGMRCVLGPMQPDVRQTIDEIALEQGATTVCVDDVPACEAFVARANIGLYGAHQRTNAKVAFLVAKELGFHERAIAEGIANVQWPGRLEMIRAGDVRVLLDCAHNPDGAEALAKAIPTFASRPESTALIFGNARRQRLATDDRRTRPLLASIRLYVAPIGREPTPPELIAERHPGAPCANTHEALQAALGELKKNSANPKNEQLLVVCGSMFLVGETRALLLNLPKDPPVSL